MIKKALAHCWMRGEERPARPWASAAIVIVLVVIDIK